MKKKEVNPAKRRYEKGQIFIKITAGILALLMVAGVAATLLFVLI